MTSGRGARDRLKALVWLVEAMFCLFAVPQEIPVFAGFRSDVYCLWFVIQF